MIGDITSKNSVLTLQNDIINKDSNIDHIERGKKEEKVKNQNVTQVQIEDINQDEKLDLFVDTLYNKIKEMTNNGIDNTNHISDINCNKKEENEQFEQDLMMNLHDINMRRTSSLESTKKTQKSLIELIEMPPKEYQSQSKINPNPFDVNHFKENIDENVVDNLNEKVTLI